VTRTHLLRFLLWSAAALPLACGGGAERRHPQEGSLEQPPGWHRVATGRPVVPLSRPSGARAAGATAPRSIGFAGGVPTDTTGALLPRALDRVGGGRYLLYLPRGIEGARRWPLILYLHGRSLSGDNLSLLTRYGLPARLEDEDDFPFVVVAPQVPVGQTWTDTDRLAALVREVRARYPVDPTRVYLIGYSMGAGGVWRAAIAHPELFAAAAPAAAWTPDPSESATRALADLPIRIYHGTADEVAPFDRAQAMARALEEAGVDVTFSAYPGADHGDLTDIYQEDELYAWLLAHRRDSAAR
jgi:pimeloyl-ACP methyl ester carboxylesterase